MRPIIISLGLFLMAALTADAVKCLRCHKNNSDTCEEESVDCPDGTQCMTMSELYQVENDTYHTIKKDCNPGFPCVGLYSSNFNDAILRIHVHCCLGDNCNKDNFNFPPDIVERKGKICPVCFAKGLKGCKSDTTERCIHPDDQCFEYIGKIRNPGNEIKEYSFKGCLSPLGCQLQFKALIGVEELQCDRFICSPGQ